MFLVNFPVFALLFMAYNLVLFSNVPLDQPIIQTPLIVQGSLLEISLNHIFIAIGVIFLYVEILKSTRTSIIAVLDHIFSFMVFVAFLVEFLVFAKAGTAVFLILTLMSMLDVIAGFTITISTARRDVVHY